MFKKAISISLVVAILTMLVRFTLPYLWYYSNYEYIARELCENRHNPDVECDGQCQLAKMIQKQQHQNDEQSTPPVVQEQRVHLFFSDLILIPIVSPSHTLLFRGYTDQLSSLWFDDPVSPPPQSV